MALTAKQQRFVEEYCIDCNATQAALRAGYSKDSAHTIGWENLQKPEIAVPIRERILEMAARAEVTQGSIIRELALLAFADMGQYSAVDEDGQVRLDFSGMGPDGLRAVKKIKQRVEMVGDPDEGLPVLYTEFELYDKQAALDKLMRYMGLYAADNERRINGQLDLNVTTVDRTPRANSMQEWLDNRRIVQQELEAMEHEDATD